MSRPGGRQGLLALSQCLPYPPDAGVTKRTYHVLRQLQRDFDVTLLPYARRAHQPDRTALERARAALAEELFDVGTPVRVAREFSSLRLAWDQLRSVATRQPYTYYEYASARFGGRLRRLLDDRSFDLVHFDSLDLYRWRDELPPDIPTACTHHSVESELLERSARHAGARPVRWYLGHQARLLERVERELCPTFSLNVCMSGVDERKLRSIAPSATTVVVPNGVDTDRFSPLGEGRRVRGRVLFVGGTYSLPNRDGVEFFVRQVWPDVRRRIDAEFEVVGRTDPRDVERLSGGEAVRWTGYVDDVRDPLSAACCSVVPLRIGGGTRLKILDAWAMGTAVVSTSIGCEGLETENGRNILIRDEPGEFAAAVVDVLRDDSLRRHLERGGRETVVREYTWDRIGSHLRAAYRALVG